MSDTEKKPVVKGPTASADAFLIQILARGSGRPCVAAGAYVARFDPDGGDPSVVYPTGTLETTPHAGRALRFATAGEAWACWQERSRRTPTRPDGKPNRPLTAFMVEIAREKKGDDDARQR